MRHWHFSGIGGVGMSAIAFYLLGRGDKVSGSDRLFDRGGGENIATALRAAGARLVPQDGNGLEAGATLVVSTAIENDTPEVTRARELRLDILHRSEALAQIANGMRTIAVSGTSGKSTVTGMIYRILAEAGLDPSVIGGATLRELTAAGEWGNAHGGKSPWLVIEADESDGSLVRYTPEVGLLLNIDRDHKELAELHDLFTTFRANTKGPFVTNGDRVDCRDIARSDDFFFGWTNAVPLPPESVTLLGDRVQFRWNGQDVLVPQPGRHTVENALASLTVAMAIGIAPSVAAEGLATFSGVGRRHEIVGEVSGVRVIDDYAHNPAKVEAAMEAARAGATSGRLLVVFQPHGYGPLKFLLHDFADSFRKALQPKDLLWIAPVYDAGGTADRTVGSPDLARLMDDQKVSAPASRVEIPGTIAKAARKGDVVLVMGARDPELPAFAKSILSALV